ncbi:MAG: glycoside hydrolase family 25 protein [Ruminococcus sp.]
MNTKKIISLISCMTVIVSGLMGRSNISYAENSADYINTTTAVVAENTTETVTTSNDPIDVFSVYDAHQKYIEASKPDTNEFVFRNGIDVSTFQHDIDWKTVKNSGVDFAIIRAGYGRELYQVDAKFHENMQKAKDAGIDCGAYWYSYATTPEQAVLEAETCYQIIKDYQFEYPIVFDIEDESQKHLSTATISAIIESFCSTLEEKGYYVSLYSYASFLNSSVYQSTLEKYDVWVAHYNVSAPSYNGNYGMWQYTSSGTVSGIEGSVDLDYSYKNYPYLMEKYHLNGF